jgi:hypothetical protein
VLTAPLLVALLASQPEPCVPGRQVSCPCAGGGEGIQTCNADGASFGPCECEPLEDRAREARSYEEEEEAYEEEEDYGPDPRDPRYLAYEEGMEIPPGYELTRRIRTGWLITGLSVFAGLYLYTVVIVSSDRSFGLNDEVNLAVLERGFASQLERDFREDLHKSRPITLEEWRTRSWAERALALGARILERQV